MKNLNKKISAVALAGMVVFGGFAASGVSSFAASGSHSLIGVAQEKPSVGRDKLEELLLNSGYKIINEKGSKWELENEIKENYSNVGRLNSYIVKVNDNNISRRLNNLLHGKWDIFGLEFKGMFYLIGKGSSQSKLPIMVKQEKPVQLIKKEQEKPASLIGVPQEKPSVGRDKLEELLLNSGYKIVNEKGSKWELENEIKENYSNVGRLNSYIVKVNDNNISRRLNNLLHGKWDIFGLEFKGMFYLIGR